jgi:hypothetical protein
MQPDQRPSGDISPDRDDRIEEFLARHGGGGSEPTRSEELEPGVRGWSEVHAADGYRLRCDWNRSGSREEMSFSEIAPPTR